MTHELPGEITPASKDNPYYPLVQTALGGQACSVLTFGVQGGWKTE